MCGIVYGHNFEKKNSVNNDVMQLFDKQRTRGLQGFGLFDGQEMNIVRETKEDNILKWLCKYDSNLILFHHRMPTSTDNVKKAAHPFSTHTYFGKHQYILVHNGHIGNAKTLKEEHEKLGIKYKSITHDGRFNDSEALLWDLALVLEGKKKELKAGGGIAFICIRLKDGKLDRMYFGRNYNPLNMEFTESSVRLSSAGPGIPAVRDRLYTYNYKTKKLFDIEFDIPYSGYEYTPVPLSGSRGVPQNWNWENSRYRHFTNRDKKTERKGEPGDWLPKDLREKYASLIDGVTIGGRSPETRKDFIDYDKDGNPVYDQSDAYEAYWRSKRPAQPLIGSVLTPEQEEEAEMLTPEMDAVYHLWFFYMGEANGNFEQAYISAEKDYELLFDVPDDDQDFDFVQGVLNMESVLEAINSDPEYEDEDSISSSWQPLTQQMLLLPA